MTKREREVTDKGEIRKILESGKIIHVGLVDEGMPYVLPMNYGFDMSDKEITFYLHSALAGYKLDVIKKNPVCCIEVDTNVVPFEGKVACQYGTSYESVIGRGTAEIIDNADSIRKMKALTKLMKNQTGKDFEFNEKMTFAVSVIELHITEYTAKRRPMPVYDTMR